MDLLASFDERNGFDVAVGFMLHGSSQALVRKTGEKTCGHRAGLDPNGVRGVFLRGDVCSLRYQIKDVYKYASSWAGCTVARELL